MDEVSSLLATDESMIASLAARERENEDAEMEADAKAKQELRKLESELSVMQQLLDQQAPFHSHLTLPAPPQPAPS